jgi:hypothetical protein
MMCPFALRAASDQRVPVHPAMPWEFIRSHRAARAVIAQQYTRVALRAVQALARDGAMKTSAKQEE